MNKLKLAFIGFSLLLVSGISSAVSISGNAQLQSDYIWRGMTQNTGDASINGGLDVEFDNGLYVGTWIASVVSGSEVDYYGGYTGSLGDIDYDIGYVKFDYPATEGGGDDFEELYIGVDLPMGIGISYASGEDGGAAGDTTGFGVSDNLEVSYGFDLGESSIGIAYGDYDGFGEYTNLTYDFSMGDFAITLGYSDYSDDASTDLTTESDNAFFINVGLL
jgi:uncharacterized protein (TIGR02001 family)